MPIFPRSQWEIADNLKKGVRQIAVPMLKLEVHQTMIEQMNAEELLKARQQIEQELRGGAKRVLHAPRECHGCGENKEKSIWQKIFKS